MLIDSSYFAGGPMVIDASTTSVSGRLNYFIELLEAEFLEKVLGYDLYQAFTAGLEASSIDQRWLNLRDGSGKWKGMVQGGEAFEVSEANQEWLTSISGTTAPITKKSPIANYVYWHWLEDQATQSTGIGEAITKSENSARTSPAEKMIRAWNEMVDMVNMLWVYLNENRSIYPEYAFVYCDHRYFRKVNPYDI